MTKSYRVFAPAKINLTLHITGRRDDGYHLLDSLVVFAGDVGDRVVVSDATALSLSVSGAFTGGVPRDDSNLVLQAARLLQDRRGVSAGAAINLEKNLPNGAGIGGGSSDAAAVLSALAQLWGVAPLTPDEALPLGADIPVCMAAPAPQRMQGIGDRLSSVPPLPDLFVVLVNCGDHIPTGPVFAALPKAADNRVPMDGFPETWTFDSFAKWLSGQTNHLTQGAMTLSDTIQPTLAALRDAGAVCADMSGSGSTCWGVFKDEVSARQAAAKIAAGHPKWWVQASGLAAKS